MNDKVVEFISSIDTKEYDKFINDTTLVSSYKVDCDINDYDYSWLNQIEQYIPFISNIVNDVKTMDNSVLVSYENRFIKTLIYSLIDFINIQKNIFLSHDLTSSEKIFNSKLNTNVNDEEIEISINIKTNKVVDSNIGTSFGLSLKERIDRVSEIANEYLNTNFMVLLKDASFVHNPVNKTAIMEEETNYRKALELYNYMDNYSHSSKDYNSENIKNKLDEQLLVSSFIEYKSFIQTINGEIEENQYKLFLDRLIEKIVSDSTYDEKSFKKMLTKKFEDEYSKKKSREQNIQGVFAKNIDNYNKQMKDAIRALKN